VVLSEGTTDLVQGSGFLYGQQEPNARPFLSLVTAYHVLTGAGPTRKQAPKGDRIRFLLHLSNEDPAAVRWVSLPLKTTDGEPTWVRSESVEEADLALVPIPYNFQVGIPKINCFTVDVINMDMRLSAGDQVSVVGYPLGYYDSKHNLPIWKTGNIASDPDVDFDGLPRFVVDVTAFKGMSGSPALAGHQVFYQPEQGIPHFGGSGRLVGVYASTIVPKGQTGSGNESYLEEILDERSGVVSYYRSLELGHVWKSRVIVEMMDRVDIGRFSDRLWPKLGDAARVL
jgi:hypothetical protein